MQATTSPHIISVYSDAEVLSDGCLIDVSSFGITHHGRAIDRVTASVSHTCYTGETQSKESQRELLRDLIVRAEQGIFHDVQRSDELISLHVVTPKNIIEKLWLVGNERNNYTLMFPEDY